MSSTNEKTPFASSFVLLAGEEISSSVRKPASSEVHVTKISQQTPANPSLDPQNAVEPRNSDASGAGSGQPNPFDTDIEAVISQSSSRANERSRVFADCRINDNDSRVWPGQKHWKKKAKEAKIKRSRTCLSHLSKKNRLAAKILIVVFVIGIAVAVGVGVSKPLGAGIWKPHNS